MYTLRNYAILRRIDTDKGIVLAYYPETALARLTRHT